VTDVLSDLRGAQPGGETAVVEPALAAGGGPAARAHGRWTGAGKALLREVRGYDASAGTAYSASLVGGGLFDGYRVDGETVTPR